MVSGIVKINSTSIESSLVSYTQIRSDPEGTVPEKKGPVPFFPLFSFITNKRWYLGERPQFVDQMFSVWYMQLSSL